MIFICASSKVVRPLVSPPIINAHPPKALPTLSAASPAEPIDLPKLPSLAVLSNNAPPKDPKAFLASSEAFFMYISDSANFFCASILASSASVSPFALLDSPSNALLVCEV